MNANDKETRARFIVFGTIFLISLTCFVLSIDKNWLGWASISLFGVMASLYAIFSHSDGA